MSSVCSYAVAWRKVKSQIDAGGFDVRKVLPKPRMLGDRAEEDRAARNYNAKIKMIVILHAFPDKVLDWLADVEQKAISYTAFSNCG